MSRTHYKHLTWQDRLKIDRMNREGMKPQQIADALRVHNSTIYRELERGKTTQLNYQGEYVEVYCPETAERKYREHLKAKGPDLKIGNDHALAAYLEDKIVNERYSPEAALKKIREDGLKFSTTISKWTLYSYIEKGVFLGLTLEKLPMHGKGKKGHKTVQRAARPPKGESIEQRPEEVQGRDVFGHWEMDTVLSGGRSRVRMLVLTERLSRREIILRIRDGKAESVVAALDKLEKKWGARRFRKVFRTITVDNGSEFQDCEGMERSCIGKGKRTAVFYCHPYSAYERGSNEVSNRMIRRWYPKGADFSLLTQADAKRVEDWMNDYPRGILGFRSAGAVFREQLREAGIDMKKPF